MKIQLYNTIVIVCMLFSCSLPDPPIDIISEEFVCGGLFTDPRDTSQFQGNFEYYVRCVKDD